MKRLILISLLIIFSSHRPATRQAITYPKAREIKSAVTHDASYDTAIGILKKYEGYRATRYELFGDTCIGYGHLLYSTDTITILTEVQADSLLRLDFDKALRFVGKLHPKLPKRKKMVLAMFAFNCGIGTLSRSQLNKSITRNESDSAIAELYVRYSHAGGRMIPRLKQRRVEEFKIWTNGKY